MRQGALTSVPKLNLGVMALVPSIFEAIAKPPSSAQTWRTSFQIPHKGREGVQLS